MCGKESMKRDDIAIQIIQQIAISFDVHEDRSTSNERLDKLINSIGEVRLNLGDKFVLITNVE